jgi:hypothetical protein
MAHASQFNRDDLLKLHEKFREMKHDITNSVAVFQAMAELGQRDPTRYGKLADLILSRGPDIVARLLAYQKCLEEKLGDESN